MRETNGWWAEEGEENKKAGDLWGNKTAFHSSTLLGVCLFLRAADNSRENRKILDIPHTLVPVWCDIHEVLPNARRDMQLTANLGGGVA